MTSIQRYLPLAGRILMAVIFLFSGFGKATDASGTLAAIQSVHMPLPPLAYGVSLAVELIGGLLLVIGYRTRLVALVLAVYCIVAALYFHTHFSDMNQLINFMKNIAMTGGFLYVIAYGAGPFSLDARFGREADRMPA